METEWRIHRSAAYVGGQRRAGAYGQGFGIQEDHGRVQPLGDTLDRLVDPTMSTSLSSELPPIIPSTSRGALQRVKLGPWCQDTILVGSAF